MSHIRSSCYLRQWFAKGANATTFAGQASRNYTTKSGGMALAFDLHEPARAVPANPRAIILMHGLFGSKKNNRGISKVLARDLGRPVYAVDLRNHGESDHDAAHDYHSMAGDVARFIEDHKLEGPTLIGHSMGAKTAMAVALQSPDLVNDLVSVDNAPLDAALLSKFGTYIQGMKNIQEAGVGKLTEADKILAEYEDSKPIRDFLLGNMRRDANNRQRFTIPLDILGSALDKMGDFPFKDPLTTRFHKPALFVRGTKSKYVPDEVIPLIGQFFPRFAMADIDAGHWVISEKPEEFRRAVVEFLAPKD